ncbi:MAG TPA: hypothetical protein VJ815_07710 [Acidimicrobiia bacterium]|nr:hypothetical protein [Acidimicrobiia bacterium]
MSSINHDSHDLELLAAHASGYEPDRIAAEALISSCEECRTLFEQQVQLRSMLMEVGSAQLTPSEQSQLLTAITAALPIPIKRKTEPQPLSPIWGRMMAAAAALAVVVGVGATIASQQGSGASATTIAADAAAAPEFAAGGATNTERAPATTAASATLAQLEAAGDLNQLKAEAEALSDEGAPTEDASVSCAEETEELVIEERGESTYQGRPVLLLLVKDDGELSPRAYFEDDCTEIPLPDED